MIATQRCKGCDTSVRLTRADVEATVARFVAGRTGSLADEPTISERLGVCEACPDLRYGTTCRWCGCLVAIRTRIARQGCPAPEPRWAAVGP